MTSKKQQQHQLSLLKTQQEQIQASFKSSSLESIKEIEGKLLGDSMAVLETANRFHELDFGEDGEVDMDNLPFDWQGLPESEKRKKVRIAKSMWMSSSDVPHGIKSAQQMVLGIMKSKAVENSGAKTLNIEAVHFPAPTLQDNNDYDTIDVVDEK